MLGWYGEIILWCEYVHEKVCVCICLLFCSLFTLKIHLGWLDHKKTSKAFLNKSRSLSFVVVWDTLRHIHTVNIMWWSPDFLCTRIQIYKPHWCLQNTTPNLTHTYTHITPLYDLMLLPSLIVKAISQLNI